MGQLMTHRGPDNFGFTVLDGVTMSHNRLSVIDLSDAANQPFSNGDYLLSYSGEIYNFRELRTKLVKEHRIEFRTTSDTEVLFHLLIHEGVEAAVRQTRGMFAFAFYDRRAGDLYLARDRMGIKPLYYYCDRENLYWSSEIKAIAKVLNLSPDPIRTLFAANNTAEKSKDLTLFKGVLAVRPGTFVKLGRRDGPRQVTYYDLLDDLDADYYAELKKMSATDVVAEFESLFIKSVRAMLVSDTPIGAFVSGGVDSSLITATAIREKADLSLFTANVVGKNSEIADVKTLTAHLHKNYHEYRYEPEMMLRDWAEVTYHYDSPIVIHVNAIPFSNVARLARDAGIKVVLSGEGADELFLGYPRLLSKRYETLAKLPVSAIRAAYRLLPRIEKHLFPDNRNSPLGFINNLVQGFEETRIREEAFDKLPGELRSDREAQLDTLTMMREHLLTLLYRNDRMGMMSSVEVRFPFLDEALVKFAINLPAKFKIGHSSRLHNVKHPFLVDKWIVRKTAEKYLPQALVRKKKQGFPVMGLRDVRVGEKFFKNGWVEDALTLGTDTQKYLIKSQDPYYIGKLASVEIFGRIFGMGQSPDQVRDHLSANVQILNEKRSKSPHQSSPPQSETAQSDPSNMISKSHDPGRSVEDAVDLLKAQGRNIIRTESCWWYNVYGQSSVYYSFPPSARISPSRSEIKKVFKLAPEAKAIRFIGSEGTIGRDSFVWTATAPYGFESLSSKARNQVRQGLKNCTVRPVPLDELASICEEAQSDSMKRMGLESHKQVFGSHMRNSPAYEAWAAFVGDRLAAYLVTYTVDDWAYIQIHRSVTEMLKYRPNNALIFTVMSELLSRPDISTVSYGWEPLYDLDSLDAFKSAMGSRKEPCKQAFVLAPHLDIFAQPSVCSAVESVSRFFGKSQRLKRIAGVCRVIRETKVNRSRGEAQPQKAFQ
jgi:asparagine synthase (glutamine-hydrolysing)